MRLPPLLEREELPDERVLPPEEYPPDERIEPVDDERTDDEDERVVLLDERTGVELEDRVTLVELLRTGVLVVVVRTGADVVRVVVVVERLGVALVRVVVVVERLGVAVVRVVVVVRLGATAALLARERVSVDAALTAVLPKVRSPVALTRVFMPRGLAPATRFAERASIRREASSPRAFTIPRDALRDANERSG